MEYNTILLSQPRAGAHLLAMQLGLMPFPMLTRDDGYKPIKGLIKEIKSGSNIWFHYKYDTKLFCFLKDYNCKKYLLLRDPRDVIVSIARYVGKLPDSPINYVVGGRYLSDYEYRERIDILIDYMPDEFNHYEKWRKTGIFTVLRYRDIICKPDVNNMTTEKRRGIVGSYKDEMTGSQIEKCNSVFTDLIKLW